MTDRLKAYVLAAAIVGCLVTMFVDVPSAVGGAPRQQGLRGQTHKAMLRPNFKGSCAASLAALQQCKPSPADPGGDCVQAKAAVNSCKQAVQALVDAINKECAADIQAFASCAGGAINGPDGAKKCPQQHQMLEACKAAAAAGRKPGPRRLLRPPRPRQ